MKPITKAQIIKAYNNGTKTTREHIYHALLAFNIFINVDKNGNICDMKQI